MSSLHPLNAALTPNYWLSAILLQMSAKVQATSGFMFQFHACEFTVL